MDSTPVALNPLEPGQRWVMLILNAIPSLMLAAGGFGLGKLLEDQLGWPWWPSFVILGLIALWGGTGAPIRRFRAWGWALADDELHVAYGVWTQVHTIVPFVRVQHIDVGQGPIERWFGLSHLIVHTSGTHNSTVTLPGLPADRAAAMRETIRRHIQTDFA